MPQANAMPKIEHEAYKNITKEKERKN